MTVWSKEDVARRLIDWHFQVEPELKAIYRIVVQNEDAPGEPIKLLEVNGATVETGRVDAFAFGPAEDITYPSVVAEVTPQEFERVRRKEIPLPAGWSLETAKEFLRPGDAHAA
jgi:hypothetical protein